MIRVLLTAAAIAGVGLAPAAGAAPAANYCATTNADGSCVYANCTEAEEAGVCDIPKGDPAYCEKQDRDGDGIACEC